MNQDSHGLVLDPDQLALLRAAFDAAWDEIATDYSTSPTSIEVGRLRLATAVLAGYKSGVRRRSTVKDAALRRMAMWRHESWIAL